MKRLNAKFILMAIVWILEGALAGFGAILPGVSGGALCVAFGMYTPIIETISQCSSFGKEKSVKGWLNNVKQALQKNGVMLLIFAIGIGIGFVGLSGITNYLMEKNATLVTCAFVGFILGTFPEIWGDAGEKGRSKASYISMIVFFAVMLVVLNFLKGLGDNTGSALLNEDFLGYFICGIFWGLSFIVPGLSSSSFILFFGLYESMTGGIKDLDMAVLIPMGLGFVASIVLLSKFISFLYDRWHSVVSHSVFGIFVATTVMIVPKFDSTMPNAVLYFVCIIGGFVISYAFTKICAKIKEQNL